MNKSTPRTRYFEELTGILKRAGFEPQTMEGEALPVHYDGESLCKVVGDGIRYFPDDINTMEKEEARDRVSEIVSTVSEYMSILESAPQLNASGLDENFKLLAEYNGCVLAGRFSGEGRGVQFVTWEWGYDHKGLYHGHYLENNYVAAKEDLAQRSGLVEKHRLFSDEQLTEIYRTADEALDNDIELSGETVSALRSICNQIEYSLPDVRDRIAAAAQASEHTQSQQFNM